VDGSYEQQLINWAHKYDGHKRLAYTPEGLRDVLKPLLEAFDATGRIPEWAGVDLLRGWAFYLARAHRHSGGWAPISEEYPEFTLVVDAINSHPAARKSDRAPVPTRAEPT
jgi:hypothetical protein